MLVDWCRVYGRELLVQIDDSDVRRGARDGGGLARERWDRKVVEVKMDRDAGCSQWDGWCRVGVCKCVFVRVSDGGGSRISGECSVKVQERQLTRATSISEHHGHSFFHCPLATTRPT